MHVQLAFAALLMVSHISCSLSPLSNRKITGPFFSLTLFLNHPPSILIQTRFGRRPALNKDLSIFEIRNAIIKLNDAFASLSNSTLPVAKRNMKERQLKTLIDEWKSKLWLAVQTNALLGKLRKITTFYQTGNLIEYYTKEILPSLTQDLIKYGSNHPLSNDIFKLYIYVNRAVDLWTRQLNGNDGLEVEFNASGSAWRVIVRKRREEVSDEEFDEILASDEQDSTATTIDDTDQQRQSGALWNAMRMFSTNQRIMHAYS